MAMLLTITDTTTTRTTIRGRRRAAWGRQPAARIGAARCSPPSG